MNKLPAKRVVASPTQKATRCNSVFTSNSPHLNLEKLPTHCPILLQDNSFTHYLRCIYIQTLRLGPIEVALRDPSSKNFFSAFAIKKAQGEIVEEELQAIVKLGETDSYLDTIFFKTSNLERTLELLHKVSGGKCFYQKCGQNQSDLPSWFDPEDFNSLSRWICALFEKALWNSLCYSKTSGVSSLSNYWKQLTTEKKQKVLGSSEELQGTFFEALEFCADQNEPYVAKSYPEMFGLYLFQNHPSCLVNNQTYQKAKEKIKFYQNSDSVKLLLEKANSENFVEFLYYCSLKRSVTAFNLVSQQVLAKIRKAFAESKDFAPEENKPLERLKRSRENSNASSRSVSTSPEDEQNPSFIQQVLFQGIKLLLTSPSSVSKYLQKYRIDQIEEFKPQGLASFKKNRKNKKNSKGSKKKKNQRPKLPRCQEFPPLYCSPLHQEIHQIAQSTIKTVSGKSHWVYQVVNTVSQMVVSMYSGKCELFGSYASGLALETSDIDLVVTDTHFNRLQIEEACLNLEKVFNCCAWVKSAEALTKASVPVLKLQIWLSYFSYQTLNEVLSVDISFDDGGRHSGLGSLKNTLSLLGSYEHLQSLVLVLKKLLYLKGLNSPYSGGINSYSLILWVVASLNRNKLQKDLGTLFLQFLQDFSELDPKTTGVSVLKGGSFYELKDSNEHFVTLDPINARNNTTRTAFRVQEILQLFKEVRQTILDLLAQGKRDILKNHIFK